jgi:hypothetical protein
MDSSDSSSELIPLHSVAPATHPFILVTTRMVLVHKRSTGAAAPGYPRPASSSIVETPEFKLVVAEFAHRAWLAQNSFINSASEASSTVALASTKI